MRYPMAGQYSRTAECDPQADHLMLGRPDHARAICPAGSPATASRPRASRSWHRAACRSGGGRARVRARGARLGQRPSRRGGRNSRRRSKNPGTQARRSGLSRRTNSSSESPTRWAARGDPLQPGIYTQDVGLVFEKTCPQGFSVWTLGAGLSPAAHRGGDCSRNATSYLALVNDRRIISSASCRCPRA